MRRTERTTTAPSEPETPEDAEPPTADEETPAPPPPRIAGEPLSGSGAPRQKVRLDESDLALDVAPPVTPAPDNVSPTPGPPSSPGASSSARPAPSDTPRPPSTTPKPGPPLARPGPATGTPSPGATPARRRLDTADVTAAGPALPATLGPAVSSLSDHVIAPVPRVLGRRPRVRKVTRVVRHVDPWTVFKVSAVFSLVVYGVLLTAGVLLWNVAYATGTVDNLERFFESFGWDTFEFNGAEIFRAAWVSGLFGAIGLTGAAVLAATLFNLITDLVGGIRFTVLEEEVVERSAAPMRRFVVRRPGGDPMPESPSPPPPRPSGGG